jgi:hypothetical protein
VPSYFLKFAARIPVKHLFPAWSMMPHCPTMPSYWAACDTMVDAVKSPVYGWGLNTALRATTIDATEVLELKASLYLGFLLGPCVRVAGAGTGGASGA